MENVLKVTVGLEVLGYELDGSDFRRKIKGLLGGKGFEIVRPVRLYGEFGHKKKCSGEEPGSCVVMLVCEDSAIAPGYRINYTGTWLYETEDTLGGIWGDILFVGEDENGLCPLNEETSVRLKKQLTGLSKSIKQSIRLESEEDVPERRAEDDA